jgi:NRPS condensation-like uncharacterized protein
VTLGATTVPFSVIDQAVHLLDVPTAPWSVQLEVRVSGHLDENRLRGAIGAALRRHPMARAHKKASRLRARLDTWVIDPRARLDPLRVIDCPDEEWLAAVRADLQSISPPLIESPPLRVVLAHHPDGDMVMLNVNHAAMDGFGAMRVLRSIARAYAGAADPSPGLDFQQTRNISALLGPPSFSLRMRRQMELMSRLRDLVVPPARVAGDGADDQEGGYGFVHSRLSREQTEAIVAGAKPATVNDVLVTALHLAIADWNAQHGTVCRRIGVLVPANLRPKEWREEIVGNFSLPARISTTTRDRRSPDRALRAVAAQTKRKKQVGMGTAFIELLGQTRLLPLWAKRVMVMALPLTGNRLVDTAMLSNLGRVDTPPSFGGGAGGGEVEELWFSPPARMPLGLTIGAATVAGRLHLVLRYRHRQFDHDAATRFADTYLRKLQAFSGRVTVDLGETDRRSPKRLRVA